MNGKTAYVSNNYLIDNKLVENMPSTPSSTGNDERYTVKDEVGVGLDVYRVGLHKYTDNKEYQC